MKKKIYLVFAVTLLYCFLYHSNNVLATGCYNVTNPGMIGNAQSGCSPFDPSLIQNLQSPSGGSGTLQYVWLYKNSSTGNNFQQISGATSSTYDPGPLTETTYFRRCARRYGCTDYVGESNILCMTVTNCCNATISGLNFYNLNNSTTHSSITNLGTYDISSLPSNWNIEANVTGTTIGSVKFDITGPVSSSHTENAIPYRTPGDAIALNLPAGFYTVVVKVYNQANAAGTKCDEKTICFTLTQCNATLDNLIIYNIDNASSFLTLTNGSTYSLSSFPANWNIEALVSGSSAQSVQFNISGTANSSNIENTIPYRTPTDAVPLNLVAGNYVVNAKVYSQDNAGGIKCDEKTITFTLTNCALTANLGSDKNICLGSSSTLTATYAGAGNCTTQGISDCNHTLANSGGWLADPTFSTLCGDSAGTKLWTQSGNGASYITLDLGSTLATGTQICVNMKLEHCSNTSSGYSNAKIQASTSSNSGFTNLASSVTFSHPTYQEYCYTLASNARYIKIIDNGNCAFRVDYVKYVTAATNNSGVSLLWSTGATTSSITVNPSATTDYWVKVTDCKGCTATDTVKVNVNDPNDNNACTIDACDPATGVVTNTPITYSDNNVCTDDYCDPITGPYYTPITYSDNDVCTDDYCDPITGPYYTPITYSDNNVCTDDYCDPITGPYYTPITYSDNNVCTDDYCDPITGPYYTPITYSDNDVCTDDYCDPITGPYYTPITYSDNNVCTDDYCDPITGPYYTPITYTDNNVCTDDYCDPITGPYYTPITYSDNDVCTDDYCDPITGPYYTPITYSDNNVCTDDYCDPITGPYYTPITYSDNNVCTDDYCDPITGPYYTPITYTDNNVCTDDYCDPITGPYYTPITYSDNDVCTDDYCDPITGPYYTPITYSDNDVCTDDYCDPITGPYYTPITYSDNNVCTDDYCDPITGPYYTPITYSDNNVCTDDYCDPITGPYYTPITYSDNDVCTDDYCDPITGPYYTPVNVDDSNPCTIDACDPINGITHVGNTPNCSINGSSFCCTGDPVQLCVPISAGAVSYLWSNGATTRCTQVFVTGTYSVTVTNANGCSSNCSKTVTFYSFPEIIVPGFGSVCDTISGGIVLSGATPIGGTYSGSGVIAGVFYPALAGLGPHMITYTYSTGFCSASDSAEIVVIECNCVIPPDPTINGLSVICTGTQGTYTAVGATGATNYVWTVPQGANIISGQGTATIVVEFTTACQSGNICVMASNPCGEAHLVCKAITAISKVPVLGAVSGQSGAVCPGLSLQYCVAPVANATNYVWTIPANTQITSGQGSNCITLSILAGFTTGNVTVKAENCKGFSGPKSITLRKLALIPGVIAGPKSNLCQKTGLVYSIANVTNATSYLWTVPVGGTIVNGQGSNSITVDYGANFVSGNISVRGVNACGNGPIRNLAVKAKAATPTTITGLNPVCANSVGVAYSVTSQPGAVYTWTVPAGSNVASGQGTANITVNWGGVSGNVSVVASNGCGNSPAKTLSVVVNSCFRGANSNDGSLSQNLLVYPNPVKTDLTIQFSTETVSDYTITLTDVIGKVVYNKEVSSIEGINQQSIKVDDFSKGLYFVTLKGLNINKTTRITVE